MQLFNTHWSNNYQDYIYFIGLSSLIFTCRQFHQHFLFAFLYESLFGSFSLVTCKLPKRRSYEKLAKKRWWNWHLKFQFLKEPLLHYPPRFDDRQRVVGVEIVWKQFYQECSKKLDHFINTKSYSKVQNELSIIRPLQDLCKWILGLINNFPWKRDRLKMTSRPALVLCWLWTTQRTLLSNIIEKTDRKPHIWALDPRSVKIRLYEIAMIVIRDGAIDT